MTDIELKDAKHRFQMQRWQAIHARGIDWQLTFDEWLNWWLTSGHWADRGVGHGKYCMSRKGDIGPYALHNIECKTFDDNSSEGATGRVSPNKGKPAWNRGRTMSDEYCAKLSAARKGVPKTAEHKAAISAAMTERAAKRKTKAQ